MRDPIDIVEWLRKEAELVALDRLVEAAAEIEQLRAANLAAVEEIVQIGADKAALLHENERLRADMDTMQRCELAARQREETACAENKKLLAAIERLRSGMKEYACTGSDMPCGCYNEFVRDTAALERLRAEIELVSK